jgi:hypothetical protein
MPNTVPSLVGGSGYVDAVELPSPGLGDEIFECVHFRRVHPLVALFANGMPE